MTTGASDADLVRAHVAGDGAALAAIYDRYAPSLFDTATALLGDRDEAADVVQDTFLAAHQHLARLRDPTRLRAWLFAVTRHEVERRGRRRRRAVPTAALADMAAPTVPDLGADLDGVELAALVRAAAAGLDERDQLVLELSMRQGLEGADLAAALGVTPAQSYSLVFRMRERVGRSLGALVVARTGRRDCPDLASILQGWDGSFSVLVRKRVARHVESCETCERTKARVALPALLSAAPAFALPVGLRDRVLSAPETEIDLALDGEGFPGRATRAAATRRPRWVVSAGAAVVAVAVLAGGTALLASRGQGNQGVTVAGTSPVVAEPTSGAPASATTAPIPSTVPTIPPRPSSTIGAPPTTPAPTTLAPTTNAAASTTPAPSTTRAPPSTTGARSTVGALSPVPPARRPSISSVSFADSVVRVGGCAPRATRVTVVTDPTTVEVRLTVTPPASRPTTSVLEPAGSNRWSGLVGPFASPGSATAQVRAIDATGNEATSSRNLSVVACST